MLNIKTLARKTWIPVAAAAMIIGSSSAMVYALNEDIPGRVSSKATAAIAVTEVNIQTPDERAAANAGYTVVDLSKKGFDDAQKKVIKDKLSRIKGITPQEIEEKYNTILSNMIPGEKDMSAEQAAAYAAGILKKAYGMDFAGYTAETTFSRNPVPNTDNWSIIFHAPKETKTSDRYYVSVDSVKGTMLDAGCYNLDYEKEVKSKNVEANEWKNKAVQEISKLLPENVSVTSSKVVGATPDIGVAVVCGISDGTAYAVRLEGENKVAAAYQYFPGGYDGSWDYRPVTTDGVG